MTLDSFYDVPRQWAHVLDAEGFDGIASTLRFSAGRSEGLALFGAAGEDITQTLDPDPVGCAKIAHRLKLTLVDTPDDEQLDIITPA